MNKYVLILGILLTAMLGGCSSDSHDASGEPHASPAKVTVASAERVAESAQEEFMGTVTARNRANLEPKIQARVDRILVSLGSRVRQGDVLAELDSRDLEARVQQARAVFEQASQDLTRFENLLSQQAATQQEYDGMKARQSVAKAGLVEAETALSYARIVAPFSGKVTGKMIDVGDLAVPGRPLFTLEEEATLRFVTTLPESRLGRITAGDSLAILVSNMSAPVRGRVEELSPSADPITHTFAVKVSLPSDPGIRPGQFGRLLLPTEGDETIFIPRSALVQRGQLDLVYVVTPDHKAMLRLVLIGRQYPDRLEILSGLRENEKVVISDQRDLSDGDLVEEKP